MQLEPRFLPPSFISNGVPKINWDHPITVGLKGVWMPGLAQFNLVSGALLKLQGTTLKFPSAGLYGSVFTMNGAAGNTGFITGEPPFISKSGGVNCSIFGLFKLAGALNSSGVAIYGERGSSGNDIIKLDVADALNKQAELTIRNDAGTLLQVSSPTPDTLWHNFLATKNGNGGSGNVILYRDGSVVSTGNWTGTDSYTDATLAGGVFNDLVDSSPASISLSITAAWLRALSPAEALLLANDPFCMLLFPEDYVAATLVGAAAAAGGVVFRKTFSSLGTRVGSRQVQGM